MKRQRGNQTYKALATWPMAIFLILILSLTSLAQTDLDYIDPNQEGIETENNPQPLTLETLSTSFSDTPMLSAMSTSIGTFPQTIVISEDNENNARTGSPDGDLNTIVGAPNWLFKYKSYPIEVSFTLEQLPTESAFIAIKAYDVDEESGEIDYVFINDPPAGPGQKGNSIGYLSGNDSTWNTTILEIPLSKLRVGKNYVTITISPGWVVMVDWIQIILDGGAVDANLSEFSIQLDDAVQSGNNVEIRSSIDIKQAGNTQYHTEYMLNNEAGDNLSTYFGSASATETAKLTMPLSSPSGNYTVVGLIKDTQTESIKARDTTSFTFVTGTVPVFGPKISHNILPANFTNGNVTIELNANNHQPEVIKNVSFWYEGNPITQTTVNNYTTGSYLATQNGSYEFTVEYSLYGTTHHSKYNVRIASIDRVGPSITTSNIQISEDASNEEVLALVDQVTTISDDMSLPATNVYSVALEDAITNTLEDKDITIVARDAAGNESSASLTLSIVPKPLLLTQEEPIQSNDQFALAATLANTGGLEITESGFVWGVSQNPTYQISNGRVTTSGSVLKGESISAVASELVSGITYYVRSFVKADGNYYYSEQRSFGIGAPKYGEFSVTAGGEIPANGGTASFTISRPADQTEGTQTVHYRTVNGTAIGGTHFSHVAGTLQFAEGEYSKTVSVSVDGGARSYNNHAATAYQNTKRNFYLEVHKVEGGATLDTTKKRATATIALDNTKTVSSLAYNQYNQVGNSNATIYYITDKGYSAHEGAKDTVTFNGLANTSLTYLNATADHYGLRFNLSISEVDDGYQWIQVINPSGGQLSYTRFEHNRGSRDTSTIGYIFPITTNAQAESFYPSSKVYTWTGSLTEGHGMNIGKNNTVYVRYDASGQDADTWRKSNFVPYVRAIDSREPQLLAVAPVASSAYGYGDEAYISLIFDEIVNSASGVTINTNLSNSPFEYVDGVGTNVLVLKGLIDKEGQNLSNIQVASINNRANIRDLASYVGTPTTESGGSTSGIVNTIRPTINITGNFTKTLPRHEIDVEVQGEASVKYAWTQSESMPVSGWMNLSSQGGTLTEALSDGTWYLHVLATHTENANTTWEYQEFFFMAPTMDIVVDNSEWAKIRNMGLVVTNSGDAPVVVSLSDAGSGTYNSSATITATRNGTYTFTLIDAYGSSITKSVDVQKIDGEGPAITLTEYLANDETYTTLDFTATSSDQLSGLAYLGYQWSDSVSVPASGWISLSLPGGAIPTYDTPGTIYLHIKAVDNVGNISTAVSLPYTLISNQPPEIEVAVDGDSLSSWTSGNVTLGYTVTKSQADIVYINAAGEEISGDETEITSPYTGTFTATKNGLYSFSVVDANRLSAQASIVVNYLDNEAPTALFSYSDGHSRSSWAKSKQIIVQAHDNVSAVVDTNGTITSYSGSGVANVAWKGAADNSYLSMANGASFTATENMDYHIKVTDNQANTNEYTLAISGIDTTAPLVEIEVPNNWQQEAYLAQVNYTDDYSGIASARYAITDNNTIQPQIDQLADLTLSSGKVNITEDGYNYIYYQVTDNAGNITTGWSAPIKMDKVTPVLGYHSYLNEPGGASYSAGTWVNQAVSFVLENTTEQLSGTTFYVKLPGGNWGALPDNSYTISEDTDASYQFKAVSGSGIASNTVSSKVRVDTIPPSFLAISGATNSWQSTAVTLEAVATDDQSGIKAFSYTTDGGITWSELIPWLSAGPNHFTVSVDGDYTDQIRFMAQDNAGNNSAASDPYTVKLDQVVPELSLSAQTLSGAPLEEMQWTNETIVFTLTNKAFQLSNTTYQISIQDGVWETLEDHTLTITEPTYANYLFRAVSGSGTVSELESFSVKMEQTPPTINARLVTDEPTNQPVDMLVTTMDNIGVAITKWASGEQAANFFGENGTELSGDSFLVPQNGTYTVYARDLAGNESVEVVEVISIVTDAPTVSFEPSGNLVPAQSHSTEVTTGVTSPAEVASSEYQWSADQAFPDEGSWISFTSGEQLAKDTHTGNYYLHVRVLDTAGNTTNASSNSFTVDNEPPVTPSLTAEPTTPTNDVVTVEITYHEDNSTKEYKVDSGDWALYTAPIEVTENSSITAREMDLAGNVSAEATIGIENIVKVPPTVEYTVNGDLTPSKVHGTQVLLGATPPAEITTSEYQWTDSQAFPTTGNWVSFASEDLLTIDSGTGEYYLHVRVTDNAGNHTQATSSGFNLDNTAPGKPVLAADPVTPTNDRVTIEITYSEETSIREYQVGLESWALYSEPIQVLANTMVSAREWDSAGNVSEVSTLVVENIVKTLPSITFDENGNETPAKNHSAQVLLDPTWPATISESTYQWTDSEQYPTTGTWISFSAGDELSINGLTGNYYLHVQVTDTAGNYQQATSNAFNLDNQPPEMPGMVAFPVTPTNDKVTTTVNYSEGDSSKQYKIGSGEWEDYTRPIEVTDNTTIAVREIDIAGNISAVNTLVIENIVKILPAVTFAQDGNETPAQSHGTQVILASTWPATISAGQYQWSDKQNLVANDAWVNFTSEETLTIDGVTGRYYLHIRVSDTASNVSQVVSEAFNLDNEAPDKPSLVASPTEPTNDRVTIDITYNEENSTKQYKLGSEDWSLYTEPFQVLDNTTVTAREIDTAGNISETATLTITNIVKTLPTATFEPDGNGRPAKNHSTQVVLAVTWPAEIRTSEYQWSVEKQFPVDGNWVSFRSQDILAISHLTGEYYLHIRITDSAGNINQVSSAAFKLDNQAPDTPLVTANPVTPTNDKVIVEITYSEPSSIKEYKIGAGPWTIYQDPIEVRANTLISARESDTAGNVSQVGVFQVENIVKTLPTVVFEPFQSKTPSKSHSTTVGLAATLPARVSASEYLWTNSEQFPTEGMWTSFTSGETISINDVTGPYFLHLRVTDTAGNMTEVTSGEFNLDNEAPTKPGMVAAPLSPTNERVWITITYSEELSTKEYQVGQSEWQVYTEPIPVDSNTVVAAREIDQAGNVSQEAELEITNIDKQPPTINLSQGPTAATNQPVTMTANITDNTGILETKWARGTQDVTYFTANGDIFEDDFLALENGLYTVYARDLAGNEAVNTIVIENIVTTKPTVSFGTDGDNDPANSHFTTVVVSATSPAEVETSEYQWSVSSEFPIEGPWTSFGSGEEIVLDGQTGEYYLHIRVSDTAGNHGSATSQPFNLDNTPPNKPEITITPSDTDGQVIVSINYAETISTKQFRVGSSSWIEYQEPFVVAADNLVSAREIDSSGNVSDESHLSINGGVVLTTVDTLTLIPGSLASWQVTVENQGNVPDSYRLVVSSNTHNWTFDDASEEVLETETLLPGESQILTVVAPIAYEHLDGTEDQLVLSVDSRSVSSVNQSQTIVGTIAAPAITLEMDALPEKNQDLGDVITYQVQIKNTGARPAEGVRVIAPVPQGTKYRVDSVTTTGLTDDQVTNSTLYDAAHNWVSLGSLRQDLTLNPGQTWNLQYQVTVGLAKGDVTNRARITYQNETGGVYQKYSEVASVAIPDQFGVGLTGETKKTVAMGGARTVEFQLTNTGNTLDKFVITSSGHQALGITWYVDLNGNLRIDEQDLKLSPSDQEGRLVTPSLKPGNTYAILADISASSSMDPGNYPLLVTVTSESDPTQYLDHQVAVEVEEIVPILNGFSPSQVYIGESFTFAVEYGIAGKTTVSGGAIKVELDPMVDFVSASGSGIYDATLHQVAWDVSRLARGVLAQQSVALTINADLERDTVISNQATLQLEGQELTTSRQMQAITRAPARLWVEADRTGLVGNGKEIITLQARIVDRLGNLVPDKTPVTFSLGDQASQVSVEFSTDGDTTSYPDRVEVSTTDGVVFVSLRANLLDEVHFQLLPVVVTAHSPDDQISQQLDLLVSAGAIVGRLRNHETNLPESGVRVELLRDGQVVDSQFTNAGGFYNFIPPAVGQYYIRAIYQSKAGEKIVTQQADVIATSGQMTASSRVINGRLIDHKTGLGIPNVVVWLRDQFGAILAQTETEGDQGEPGFYEFVLDDANIQQGQISTLASGNSAQITRDNWVVEASLTGGH